MRECVDAWMRGCANACVRGCANALRWWLSSNQEGQKLRPSGRFGNSGGARRSYYQALYKAKGQGGQKGAHLSVCVLCLSSGRPLRSYATCLA